jgi:hypothetical protein
LVLPSIWSSIPSCAASPSDSAAPCEKAGSNKSPCSMARTLRSEFGNAARTVHEPSFCRALSPPSPSPSPAPRQLRPPLPQALQKAKCDQLDPYAAHSVNGSHVMCAGGLPIRGERVTHAPAFAAAYCPKNWPSFSSTSSAFLLSSPTYAHNAASAASASACDCRRSAAFCECSQSPVGRT